MSLAGLAPRAALVQVLGPTSLAALDEFTVDYLVDIVSADSDSGADALAEGIGPFLVDAGAAEDDAAVGALCEQ
jgi:hypothetical protein